MFIQVGQPEFDSSNSSRPGMEPSLDLLDLDEKSRASLDSPTFLIASFVVKLVNISNRLLSLEVLRREKKFKIITSM